MASALSLNQLAPDARVALFRSSRMPQRRPVESLVPAARKTLIELGCWEAFKAAAFPESFGSRAVWGSGEPYENEFLYSLHGCGWHVNRDRFDSLLLQCAMAAGIDVHEAGGLSPGSNFTIDASGRSAIFATRQGAVRHPSDALVGVFAEFETSEPCDTYTLVEAQEDGWWYSGPIGELTAIAVWMSDSDLVRQSRVHETPHFMAKLATARFTNNRLHGARLLHKPVIHAAQSQCLQPAAGPDWVAAGDAAMTVDPLSSQGILNALRLGRLASFVAFDHLQGRVSHERYGQLLTKEYAAYDNTRREFYSVEQRWRQAPFWIRRAEHSEVG